MLKRLQRYEDTAANLAADNRVYPANWEIVEKDTGRSSLFSRLDGSSGANPSTGPLLVGTAGQTLGFLLDVGFGSAATVVADIHGYYANA